MQPLALFFSDFSESFYIPLRIYTLESVFKRIIQAFSRKYSPITVFRVFRFDLKTVRWARPNVHQVGINVYPFLFPQIPHGKR